jgi:hypothetical protein
VMSFAAARMRAPPARIRSPQVLLLFQEKIFLRHCTTYERASGDVLRCSAHESSARAAARPPRFCFSFKRRFFSVTAQPTSAPAVMSFAAARMRAPPTRMPVPQVLLLFEEKILLRHCTRHQRATYGGAPGSSFLATCAAGQSE